MLRDAAGGSVRGCFEGLPGRAARTGSAIPSEQCSSLVVLAMLHGKAKLVTIAAWIAHADQEPWN